MGKSRSALRAEGCFGPESPATPSLRARTLCLPLPLPDQIPPTRVAAGTAGLGWGLGRDLGPLPSTLLSAQKKSDLRGLLNLIPGAYSGALPSPDRLKPCSVPQVKLLLFCRRRRGSERSKLIHGFAEHFSPGTVLGLGCCSTQNRQKPLLSDA